MVSINIVPDSIDDAIDKVQAKRAAAKKACRIIAEVEFTVDGGSVAETYEQIKNYVESYPDMVLFLSGHKLIFKSNYLGE